MSGQAVEVVWRECRWQFDDQLILRAVAADGASTIDGIRVGDPISAAAVLGQPVKTEAAAQGEWRYYLADRAAKLAWRLRVENDRITASVLCACLPDPPESRRSWPGLIAMASTAAADSVRRHDTMPE